MEDVLLVLLGGIDGFAIHALSMKVSFKQCTIENKIKVYDALIGVWVRMRNFVYTHHRGQPVEVVPPNIAHEFDQMYGSSQQLVGEAILVCEDDALTTAVNALNEKLYRTEWHKLEWAAVSISGAYHRASSRKAMLMDMKRLSSTEVEYVGRHSGRWADFITLEVGEDADGWKVLRVIKHEAA